MEQVLRWVLPSCHLISPQHSCQVKRRAIHKPQMSQLRLVGNLPKVTGPHAGRRTGHSERDQAPACSAGLSPPGSGLSCGARNTR